ncbi:MAG: DUF3011 domain-containing protein [Gemmatimonadota bacterium]|nr:DUF3011 domain-containing protein [Gemmatimonadota bacterium]
MHRLTRCLVVLSLLAPISLLPTAPLAAQTKTVLCESRGGDRIQCGIEQNARVELTRNLSDTPCQQNRNWGVGPNYIWVTTGCRGEFTVTSAGFGGGTGGPSASPRQVQVCRSEADRRLAAYSYYQISAEPESRQGSLAYVRWRAGTSSGLCAVAANGRIIQFTTDPAGNVGTTTRLTCESRSTDRQECAIPAGARMRIIRQIGQNPCRLNDTYGRGQSYIWVAEGCRAEFEVVTTGAGTGGSGLVISQVTCASAVNSRRQCVITQGAQVRLARQMSSIPCRYGESWGIGTGHIWVSRGCSGQFDVAVKAGSGGSQGGNTGGGWNDNSGADGGGWQGGNSGADGGWQGGNSGASTTRLVCSARGAAREECRVAGATSVRLLKEYSIRVCRLNESFGIGFGHMWVSGGCRGEFELTLGGSQVGGPGGAGDNSGLPSNSGLAERVTCESKGGERAECKVKAGGQVRLVRQLSTTPCTMNSTWGMGYGTVWVTRGCRAEFEVR